jgi:hypothetical protein
LLLKLPHALRQVHKDGHVHEVLRIQKLKQSLHEGIAGLPVIAVILRNIGKSVAEADVILKQEEEIILGQLTDAPHVAAHVKLLY